MGARVEGLFKGTACQCAQPSKCRHPWNFTMHWAGKKHFVALLKFMRVHGIKRKLDDRAGAEAIAALIEPLIRAGVDPYQPPTAPSVESGPATKPAPDAPTFAYAADADLEERAALASFTNEQKRFARIARVVLPGETSPIGAWPVASFTRPIVLKVYRALTATSKNSDKLKYARSLKRVFTIALREGWITRSPFADEKPRARMLPAGQCEMRHERCKPELEARLLAGCDRIGGDEGRWMRAFVETSIECGARPGELLVAHVDHFQFDEGQVLIAAVEAGGKKTGKNGEPGRARLVPMDPIDSKIRALVPALFFGLDGRPLPPSAYAFHDGNGGRVSSSTLAWRWKKLIAASFDIPWTYAPTSAGGNLSPATVEAINLANVNLYDLRHEAALRWHEAGDSLNVIARMLGHANLEQLKVYLGIKDADAIDAYKQRRIAAAGLAPAPAPVAKPAPARLTLAKGHKRAS